MVKKVVSSFKISCPDSVGVKLISTVFLSLIYEHSFNSYSSWIILFIVLELLENESRRTAQARWGWGWTYGDSRKRAKENFEYDSAGRNWAKAPPPAGLAPPFLKSSLSSALQWRNAMCPEHFKFSVSSIIWDISNFNFDAVDQSQSQCAKSGFKIFTKIKNREKRPNWTFT